MSDIKEEAKRDYLKGMKYKDLATKYEVSLNTIKSWKQRYDWNRSVHTKDKKGCIQNKGKKTGKRIGPPFGNKNSVNHASSVPKRNKNAETHGFFSRYLPEETNDIINEIMVMHPLDILWNNITIQYAAIIRSQRIMYVTDKDEMIKELKSSSVKTTSKTNSNSSEEKYEYEFQFAWDRQATYLNAQSRAMSTLQSMIRNYDEMLHKNWDLATEEQIQRIEKLKVDIKMGGKQNGVDIDDDEQQGVVILPAQDLSLIPKDGE